MILALESSCDETALALFDPARGLVGEWVNSQMALHERYGGVVPDLATREHLRTVGPMLEVVRAQHDLAAVSQIAVTHGPGLAGCLAIGSAAAKALSVALGVPLVGVNHLRGHAFSPFITLHAVAPAEFEARLAALLPHLGLVVSGGNTLLFSLDTDRRIKLISSTRDDAAGEALDKGAKLLGLGYPGGPLVEKLAQNGDPTAYDFPRGIGNKAELDFSFSGLKTSLRYQLEKMSPDEIAVRTPDLCASYQQAVIDALVRKSKLALRTGTFRSIGLSGGVANNRPLRTAMSTMAQRQGVAWVAAEPRHTGDNGGMIAFAAWVDPTVASTDPVRLEIHPSLPLAVPAANQD
ncbi:tRNA (adenosine(37)-N6)-threonylcarbamoyltransferase complex transferase subunit TsaD [Synoicihabitans lomoniglobus]|uniref:tRNA N6-adenosine threonylcarbamoyltransferase n=1 Tax=Synoicihabitans lomoniglobus TaxID=2909285 RepID=A0AAF0I415_9BACT|nr:tRNA (adenosine(37)-N6)-threonylcarbamoyltransferase complex transferase subunit TsaD [Opitutaceae bacterium LMO-M01]WED66494.1 tRNA (adenosine(37)-N6)-threonylcarbamoyltransferase complex transferase subunit TsaD [Opitutaceae bacterium LMO-M01]